MAITPDLQRVLHAYGIDNIEETNSEVYTHSATYGGNPCGLNIQCANRYSYICIHAAAPMDNLIAYIALDPKYNLASYNLWP